MIAKIFLTVIVASIATVVGIGLVVGLAVAKEMRAANISVPSGPAITRQIVWQPSNGYPEQQELWISITGEEVAQADRYRHRRGGNYGRMLSEAEREYDDSWIDAIKRIAAKTGQPVWDVARDVVQQGIPWTAQVGAAYLPNEVWSRDAGDCDDKAITLAGLLEHLGFDSGIWLIEQDDHAAVVAAVPVNVQDPASYIVVNGKSFYFIESTVSVPVGAVPNFPHWHQGQAIFPK
jgi:hypothetical protein